MINNFNLCPMCGEKNIQNIDNIKWFCPDCEFELFRNVASAVGIIIYDEKPIPKDDSIELKIMDDELIVYTGSGITDESIAEEEWEETEIKADTLLAVLNKIK